MNLFASMDGKCVEHGTDALECPLRVHSSMRALHVSFRIVTVAGCAFAFACALVIVWATCVAGTMPAEWWMAWTRFMVTGKVLAATGVFGEARVKVWRREFATRAATSIAAATEAAPWRLDIASR